MTFSDLREFLETRMRQSHVYQPVLIGALIDSGGSATVRQHTPNPRGGVRGVIPERMHYDLPDPADPIR